MMYHILVQIYILNETIYNFAFSDKRMKFNDIFIKFGNTSENGQSYPNQTVGLSK